jgi:hypothetical protein
MQVDPITLIEVEKEAYAGNDSDGLSFSQWLAYIIGIQLMFAEIMKKEA